MISKEDQFLYEAGSTSLIGSFIKRFFMKSFMKSLDKKYARYEVFMDWLRIQNQKSKKL